MIEYPREIQLAWLAGMIDGEGSICLGVPSSPNQLRLRLFLKSSDKFVIDTIHEIFGGRLEHRAGQKSWKENWSDQWGWVISRRKELLDLLSEVEPYLVLKKAKCNLAIEKLTGLV